MLFRSARVGYRQFPTGCFHILYAACFCFSGRHGLPDLCIVHPGRVLVPFGITLSIQWLPVLFLLYFGLLPAFCHGQTPGKRLTRMKIVQANSDTAHWYQYFLRYGLLITGLVGVPYWLNRLLFILMNVLHLDSLASLVLHGLLVGVYLFWLFFAGIRMALHKPLFYERWSRTKLISTVKRT